MSRLLLDTHALLWWLADDPKLTEPARSHIAEPTADVYVSAASVWEVSIKRSLGKLDAPNDLLAVIASSAFTELPIAAEHARRAGRLEHHHSDPFDRMLIAQAMIEKLSVVTHDTRFAAYDVQIIAA